MGRLPSLLDAGTLVGGRYQIQGFLAEGGMAMVYRALHTGTHRQVALKVVHPQLAKRARIVEKFLDEARLAGKIPSHPNIVQVFDSGCDEESGAPFIAMELIEGQLLDEYINGLALPWRVVKLLTGQLADALGEAHARKIIHRDLKPSNLIVTTDRKGEPQLKVLDFGIAKVLGDGAVATATQIGTPLFCAPEQLGASMRKVAAMRDFTIEVGVSPATDVWAAALIVYQMLTGYPPTQYWRVDEMAALIAKIALDEREPPSMCAGERALHLPHGFDEWYLRCLRHAASERYQQIGEAMSALSLLLDNDPSEAVERAAAANGEKGRETLRIAVPGISEGGSRKSPREASENDDDVPLAADDVPRPLPLLVPSEQQHSDPSPGLVGSQHDPVNHEETRVWDRRPHIDALDGKRELPSLMDMTGPSFWQPSPRTHATTAIISQPLGDAAVQPPGATPYAAWLPSPQTQVPPERVAALVGALSAVAVALLVGTIWLAVDDEVSTLHALPLAIDPPLMVGARVPAGAGAKVVGSAEAGAPSTAAPKLDAAAGPATVDEDEPPAGVTASASAAASAAASASAPPPRPVRRHDPVWGWN